MKIQKQFFEIVFTQSKVDESLYRKYLMFSGPIISYFLLPGKERTFTHLCVLMLGKFAKDLSQLPQVFFFFFGRVLSMWKFPVQESDPCHSSNLSCNSGNTGFIQFYQYILSSSIYIFSTYIMSILLSNFKSAWPK